MFWAALVSFLVDFCEETDRRWKVLTPDEKARYITFNRGKW